jgi:hypothetical protein
MITILLTFLRYAWPYLVGAFLIGGAYYWAYNRGVDHERVRTIAAQAETKRVQGEFDGYRNQAETQARAAKAAVDALQQRWDGERIAANAALAAANKARKDAFDRLAQRALGDVPASPSGLGSAARVVMRDASAAANRGAEAPALAADAGSSTQPAETVSQRAVAAAWVAASEAYADARGKWAACVLFYDSLRSAQ